MISASVSLYGFRVAALSKQVNVDEIDVSSIGTAASISFTTSTTSRVSYLEYEETSASNGQKPYRRYDEETRACLYDAGCIIDHKATTRSKGERWAQADTGHPPENLGG